MNIKQMLYQYPHIPEDIQKLNRELNSIIQCKDETYNTLEAAKITGMPHGTEISNQPLNAVQRIIDRYGQRIEEITEEINTLLDIQQDITTIFYKENLLSHEERRIIDLRYFELNNWDRIPYIMNYGRAQCFRIHNEAIRKLESTNVVHIKII